MLHESWICLDLDSREALIREMVFERMPQTVPVADQVIGSYFIYSKDSTLAKVAKNIAKQQTTGVDENGSNSLLGKCRANVVHVVPFDKRLENVGLVQIAFPARIFKTDSDVCYSNDLLHIVSGAVQHDLVDSTDVKLVDIAMPPDLIRSFPGPALGVSGFAELTRTKGKGFPLIGTIVKPCTGLTTHELVEIVSMVCRSEQLVFIKEDENLHPEFPECPLSKRAKAVQKVVDQANAARSRTRLIYAPHISGSPSRFLDYLHMALDAGVHAVMFSETYAGGLFRLARETIQKRRQSCMIYGHNGGIGSKARSIYREVLDLLGRLDGIDFRQTAPVGNNAYLRPNGLEWKNSERILQMPLQNHPKTIAVRAGGLDQGNIIENLQGAKEEGFENYLFLFGSALNGFMGKNGCYDSCGGLAAVEQAVAAFQDRTYTFHNLTGPEHVEELTHYARSHSMSELISALQQRYGT